MSLSHTCYFGWRSGWHGKRPVWNRSREQARNSRADVWNHYSTAFPWPLLTNKSYIQPLNAWRALHAPPPPRTTSPLLLLHPPMPGTPDPADSSSTEYADHSRTAPRHGLAKAVLKRETCLTKRSQWELPQCLTHRRPSLLWKTSSSEKYTAPMHVMPTRCLAKGPTDTHWGWSHMRFPAGDCWGTSSQGWGFVHPEDAPSHQLGLTAHLK